MLCLGDADDDEGWIIPKKTVSIKHVTIEHHNNPVVHDTTSGPETVCTFEYIKQWLFSRQAERR